MGHYIISECKLSEDHEIYQNMMEKERMMKFLDGVLD